jgi:hypothetical protein
VPAYPAPGAVAVEVDGLAGAAATADGVLLLEENGFLNDKPDELPPVEQPANPAMVNTTIAYRARELCIVRCPVKMDKKRAGSAMTSMSIAAGGILFLEDPVVTRNEERCRIDRTDGLV